MLFVQGWATCRSGRVPAVAVGGYSASLLLFVQEPYAAGHMTDPHSRDLLDLATQYHQALPGRIRAYLNGRGIPDLLIDFHLLGWNGWRITIPVFNREGDLA